MKRLVALALAFVASIAAADPSNPCNVPAPNVPYAYADFAATSVFACAPAPAGVGTVPSLRVNSAGAMVYWYCPTPTGRWTANWTVGTAAFLSNSGSTLLADLYAALGSQSPVTAMNTLVAKNATLPLSDTSLTPIWCPFASEMLANTPAAVVVSPTVWRTPAAGTLTLYRATAGKLTTVVSGRKAPAAALCECASSAMVGGSKYCSISGATATELTLCLQSK